MFAPVLWFYVELSNSSQTLTATDWFKFRTVHTTGRSRKRGNPPKRWPMGPSRAAVEGEEAEGWVAPPRPVGIAPMPAFFERVDIHLAQGRFLEGIPKFTVPK